MRAMDPAPLIARCRSLDADAWSALDAAAQAELRAHIERLARDEDEAIYIPACLALGGLAAVDPAARRFVLDDGLCAYWAAPHPERNVHLARHCAIALGALAGRCPELEIESPRAGRRVTLIDELCAYLDLDEGGDIDPWIRGSALLGLPEAARAVAARLRARRPPPLSDELARARLPHAAAAAAALAAWEAARPDGAWRASDGEAARRAVAARLRDEGAVADDVDRVLRALDRKLEARVKNLPSLLRRLARRVSEPAYYKNLPRVIGALDDPEILDGEDVCELIVELVQKVPLIPPRIGPPVEHDDSFAAELVALLGRLDGAKRVARDRADQTLATAIGRMAQPTPVCLAMLLEAEARDVLPSFRHACHVWLSTTHPWAAAQLRRDGEGALAHLDRLLAQVTRAAVWREAPAQATVIELLLLRAVDAAAAARATVPLHAHLLAEVLPRMATLNDDVFALMLRGTKKLACRDLRRTSGQPHPAELALAHLDAIGPLCRLRGLTIEKDLATIVLWSLEALERADAPAVEGRSWSRARFPLTMHGLDTLFLSEPAETLLREMRLLCQSPELLAALQLYDRLAHLDVSWTAEPHPPPRFAESYEQAIARVAEARAGEAPTGPLGRAIVEDLLTWGRLLCARDAATEESGAERFAEFLRPLVLRAACAAAGVRPGRPGSDTAVAAHEQKYRALLGDLLRDRAQDLLLVQTVPLAEADPVLERLASRTRTFVTDGLAALLPTNERLLALRVAAGLERFVDANRRHVHQLRHELEGSDWPRLEKLIASDAGAWWSARLVHELVAWHERRIERALARGAEVELARRMNDLRRFVDAQAPGERRALEAIEERVQRWERDRSTPVRWRASVAPLGRRAKWFMQETAIPLLLFQSALIAQDPVLKIASSLPTTRVALFAAGCLFFPFIYDLLDLRSRPGMRYAWLRAARRTLRTATAAAVVWLLAHAFLTPYLRDELGNHADALAPGALRYGLLIASLSVVATLFLDRFKRDNG
jgi:hypothetical protein